MLSARSSAASDSRARALRSAAAENPGDRTPLGTTQSTSRIGPEPQSLWSFWPVMWRPSSNCRCKLAILTCDERFTEFTLGNVRIDLRENRHRGQGSCVITASFVRLECAWASVQGSSRRLMQRQRSQTSHPMVGSVVTLSTCLGGEAPMRYRKLPLPVHAQASRRSPQLVGASASTGGRRLLSAVRESDWRRTLTSPRTAHPITATKCLQRSVELDPFNYARDGIAFDTERRRCRTGSRPAAVPHILPSAFEAVIPLDVRATPTQFLGSEALFIMPHLCDGLETTQTLEGVLRESVGSRTWPVCGWRLAGPGSVSPL